MRQLRSQPSTQLKWLRQNMSSITEVNTEGLGSCLPRGIWISDLTSRGHTFVATCLRLPWWTCRNGQVSLSSSMPIQSQRRASAPPVESSITRSLTRRFFLAGMGRQAVTMKCCSPLVTHRVDDDVDTQLVSRQAVLRWIA